MRPLAEQNYYELLEVGREGSADLVDRLLHGRLLNRRISCGRLRHGAGGHLHRLG